MIVVTAVTFRSDFGCNHGYSNKAGLGRQDVLGTAECEAETVVAADMLDTAEDDVETADTVRHTAKGAAVAREVQKSVRVVSVR